MRRVCAFEPMSAREWRKQLMEVLAEELMPHGFRKAGFHLWRRRESTWTVVWLWRMDKPAREDELSVSIEVSRHFSDVEIMPKTYECHWLGGPFTMSDSGLKQYSWTMRSEDEVLRLRDVFRKDLIPQILRIEEVLATREDVLALRSPHSDATLDPYGRTRGLT